MLPLQPTAASSVDEAASFAYQRERQTLAANRSKETHYWEIATFGRQCDIEIGHARSQFPIRKRPTITHDFLISAAAVSVPVD